jgi:hypothetical protein
MPAKGERDLDAEVITVGRFARLIACSAGFRHPLA